MTAKRKTIYIVWNYLRWGGAQIYFLAIIKIAREEWNVVVILPKGSSEEFMGFLDELEVEYRFLDHAIDLEAPTSFKNKFSRQLLRIRSEISMFRALRKLGINGNVVHIEVAPWQSWQLLTALILSGAHVFVTLHTFRLEAAFLKKAIWKARMKFLSRLPRFHVFTSNVYAKDQYRGWFTPGFEDDISVTYTAVNPTEIEEASNANAGMAIRKQFDIPPEAKVILTVGQFIDLKGRWVLLEAATEVTKVNTDVFFVWLMQDPMDNETKVKVEQYGLAKRFLPITSTQVGNRQKILEFFTMADIFVLPSYLEGLPIALLEAMALRIPSVSTNVYAIPEAIKDNLTGLLIEPGRSDQLSTAILRLLNDKDLCRSLAEKGSHHVLHTFDERDAAKTVLAAYRNSIGSK